MLIQSHNDIIKIFPAIPDAWQDVVFHNLRVQGAFLVSAKLKSGEIEFVKIKSLAGERLRIIPNLKGDLKYKSTANIQIRKINDSIYELDLPKNSEIILYNKDYDSNIEPIEAQEIMCNYFGSSKLWRRYGVPFLNS